MILITNKGDFFIIIQLEHSKKKVLNLSWLEASNFIICLTGGNMYYLALSILLSGGLPEAEMLFDRL